MTTIPRGIVLFVGTMVLLVLGLLYAWSIFVAPLEEEFGWTRAETSLTFSVSMVMWSFGMLANGQLVKVLSMRLCYLIGIGCIVCGFVLTSLAAELYQLYLCYGMLCGFGTGLSYNLWLSSTLKYFPDKVGFASGVLLMGFGLGALILGSVVSILLQSDLQWRGTLRVLALGVVILFLISSPFLRKAPSVATKTSKAAVPAPERINLTGPQTLKQPSFWLFTLWKVLVMGMGAAVIAQAAPLMASMGTPGIFETVAIGALSVGNGCSRPLIGAIYDRLGSSKTMTLLAAFAALCGILVVAAFYAQATILLSVGLFLEGLVYGGYAAINTSFIDTTYGQAHLATNLGLSSFTLMPFNAVFPLLSGLLFQLTASYGLFLWILPTVGTISFISSFSVKRSVIRMNERLASQKTPSN